jgi:hypothetical protein
MLFFLLICTQFNNNLHKSNLLTSSAFLKFTKEHKTTPYLNGSTNFEASDCPREIDRNLIHFQHVTDGSVSEEICCTLWQLLISLFCR